jgi:cytochrome c553
VRTLGGLLCSLLLSACARVSAKEGDCTFDTPLVKGVPGSPGHMIASERNPNGASELATLMRQMVSDLEAARADLNQRPALWPRHRRLRCAWPTEPSDRNKTFDALAVQYLAQLQAFDTERENPQAAYQRVVDACVACHEQSCDGPLERILKLRAP